MGLKLGYKQTEVGVIPEDWVLRPFMTVVQIASGQVNPTREPFRSMVLVAPDHIESGSGRLLKKETSDEQHAISGKYMFATGDIVYSKIRPYLRKAILADFDGLCSADMYPLRSSEDSSAGFIFATILAHHFSRYAESVSVRSGMPKINRVELAEYTFALPPTKDEQEAIAEALSDANALIESLEQLLAKKRHIKRGAMEELLNGRKRLPGFEIVPGYKRTEYGIIPRDWVVRPFLTAVRVANGQVDPTIEPYRSMVLIGPEHIESTTGSLLEKVTARDQHAISGKYLFAPGDVVYGKINPYLRKVILADFEGLCSADMYPLRATSDVSSGFIFAVILGDHFTRYAESVSVRSGIPKINRVELADYKIALPTTKTEQEAIAAVISDMNAEIETLETKLTKARQLKQGMMQELLTGRIRLV